MNEQLSQTPVSGCADDDLQNYPEINTAIENCMRILIPAIEKSGYDNPKIESEISVSGGKKFKFLFERTDMD